MSVRLLYFARVRERLGKSEELVDLPRDLSTVGDLLGWMAARNEIFADPALRVAVDLELATPQTDVRGAGEIAFFPPVTGG